MPAGASAARLIALLYNEEQASEAARDLKARAVTRDGMPRRAEMAE